LGSSGVLSIFHIRMKQYFIVKSLLALVFTIFWTSGFAQIGKTETGIASFYHDKFVGRKTANGEIYSQDKLTAAHKNLPLGTWVRVTNLNNDSTVIVRINDRMPQWNKRAIDLTEKAAGQLNFISSGLTKVKVEVIPNPNLTLPTALSPRDLPIVPIAMIKPQPFEVSKDGSIDIASINESINWEPFDANIKKYKKKQK
jgi:rare lipoprotein A